MDVREKLVNIVKKASYRCLPSNTQDLHINMFVTDLLAHGVTVQEWISVKDRLPEKPMKCLVYTKRGEYGGYEITYYNEGFYLQYANVTHWMPLPQPPKGE